MFKISNFNLQKKGFTMIELLVAMSVFAILTSIAAGGFINVLRNQRTVAALMAANDNMGIAMEQIAREMRTGYNFCKVAGSSSKFQFINSKNEVVRYQFNNNGIERSVSKTFGDTTPTCNDTDDSNWFSYNKITADNVKINKFNVGICGKNIINSTLLDDCGPGGISYPPRITLGIGITSSEPDIEKLGISTNIQTTVTARTIQ